MNHLGIVIDISHASEKAKGEIVDANQAPVVTSHNGLQHFSSYPGNITDETLQAIATKGGLIGLHTAGWIPSQESFDWGFHRPRTAPPPTWAGRLRVELSRSALDYGDHIAKVDSLMADKWATQYGYG